jgi:hypothetical protein
MCTLLFVWLHVSCIFTAYAATSRNVKFKSCQLPLKKLNELWKNPVNLIVLKKKWISFSITDKSYCNVGIFCLCVLILGKIFEVIPGCIRFAGILHWNITACFIQLNACAIFKIHEYTAGRNICLSSFKNLILATSVNCLETMMRNRWNYREQTRHRCLTSRVG